MKRSTHLCAGVLGAAVVLCLGAVLPQDPNKPKGARARQGEARKTIEAKVETASELVALHEQAVARVRTMASAAQVSPVDVDARVRRLIVARLRVLECRQELEVFDGRGGAAVGKNLREILEARIAAAAELVALEQRGADRARQMLQVGRGDTLAVSDAQIRLVEARLLMLECRQDLQVIAPR